MCAVFDRIVIAIIESRQSSMKINLESKKVESLPANLSNKFAISNYFVLFLRFRIINHLQPITESH